MILRKFNAGVLDPLDNFDFLVPEHDKQRGMMQQYYLNVFIYKVLVLLLL